MNAGPMVANASCQFVNFGILACCRQYAGTRFAGPPLADGAEQLTFPASRQREISLPLALGWKGDSP
jgi:hypothetical protein